MAKVSIIVPVYNVEKYLKRCLDSIIHQSFSDIEIICVNDGSTDNSGRILSDFSKTDKRIKIITQSNVGSSMARNHGLKQATGEYVCFIDSDDTINNDFVEKLYGKAIETNSDVVMAPTKYIKQDKIKQDHFTECVLFNFCDKLEYLSHGGACNKLYKKGFLQQYDLLFPKGMLWEDNPFTIKVCYYSNKMAIITDTYYNYFMNPYSNVHDFNKREKRKADSLKIVDLIMKFLRQQNCSDAEKMMAIKFFLKSFINKSYLKDSCYRVQFEQITGKTLQEIDYPFCKKKHSFSKIFNLKYQIKALFQHTSQKTLLTITCKKNLKTIKKMKRAFLRIFSLLILDKDKRHQFRKKYGLKREVDISLIKKGKYTSIGAETRIENSETTIGSFCSISHHVLLGASQHPIDWISTHSFQYKTEKEFPTKRLEKFEHSNEPCQVGNDVWIGAYAVIMQGITIGDGAIIGANAVVTHNVPPYAIVVGMPAKIIRYRFNQKTIKELLNLQWWNLPDEQIAELDFKNVQNCIKQLKQKEKNG